ncbi:DUF4145 domain-containing protein [Patescibacteria group bacterium]
MPFKGHKSVTKHDGSTPDSWTKLTCGHCNTQISGAVVCGLYEQASNVRWILCPNCNDGSVLARDRNLYPGVVFGPNIVGLPKDIKAAYDEARKCMSVNSYTACELLCRKILMHIAVEKGAKEGDSFSNYIDFIENKGFITPPMKKWVTLIKKHGNKSTHKLETPEKERAESTIMFTAELLRLIYEMEHMSKKYNPVK